MNQRRISEIDDVLQNAEEIKRIERHNKFIGNTNNINKIRIHKRDKTKEKLKQKKKLKLRSNKKINIEMEKLMEEKILPASHHKKK